MPTDPTTDAITVADAEGTASPNALTELPEGVTPEDADRVRRYVEAGKAPETARVYKVQWTQFETWCNERGADPLPARPEVVASYLTERGADRSTAWVTQARSAIRNEHEMHGMDSPTEHTGVTKAVNGLRREHGTPSTSKAALLLEELRAMVHAVTPETDLPPDAPAKDRGNYLRGLRDRALLLLGYAGALRRSELATIRAEHINWNEHGFELQIPRSKGDQEGKGAVVGINKGNGLCPVRALRTWMNAAGIESGPIFRAVPWYGKVDADPEATPITGTTVRNVVVDAAEAAGLDGDYAGHSLRRGHITQAALNGAALPALQRQARHASPATTSGYIEDARRMETNTSRMLGL